MKRAAFIVLFLFVFTFVALSQTIIENPEKPLSKNAGRVLKLKEIMRITDEGGEFYFGGPRNVKVTSDGSIFIQDKEKILKFSPEGEFIKNLYKKGQGPGEIMDYFSYHIHKNEMFIWVPMANKVIHTDSDGGLVDEFKVESGVYKEFLGKMDGWLIFLNSVWPVERKTSRLYDLKDTVVLVSEDGKTEKESHVFPRIFFLIALSQEGGFKRWASFYSILSEDRRYLFVSHTREYLINLLNLKKGQVIRSFKRKYPRIKHVMTDRDKEFYKKYHPPKKKYKNDINGLFLCRDLLWVKTSTQNKKKGILFDVFNSKGQYLDNFYLNLNGSLVGIHDDSLFVTEEDEDGNMNIVKYKIVE